MSITAVTKSTYSLSGYRGLDKWTKSMILSLVVQKAPTYYIVKCSVLVNYTIVLYGNCQHRYACLIAVLLIFFCLVCGGRG